MSALVATPAGRDAAIAKLQEHFARDHLEVAAFEWRVELCEKAETQADLDRALSGLPSLETALVKHGQTTSTARALFSTVERKGAWSVPSRVICAATFGNVDVDLTSAVLGPGTTTIEVRATFGNVTVRVPEGLAVECEGGAILGSFTEVHTLAVSKRDARRVRIVGRALLGSVDVVVVPKPRGLLAAVKDVLLGR